MKWMLMRYMAEAHIDSFTDLAKATGIKRKTLYDRMREPRNIKAFEIEALDEVLHFNTEDIARLARGQV